MCWEKSNILTCQQERKRERKKEKNSPVKLDQTRFIPGMIIKPLLACISRNKKSNVHRARVIFHTRC